MTITWKDIAKLYIIILAFFILLLSLDLGALIAANDFLNYYDAYHRVNFEGGFAQFGTDVFILVYYSFSNLFLRNLDIDEFLVVHFFLPYLLAATVLYRISRGPAMFLIMIVLFDAYLSNHLARQFIASAFVILSLVEYFGRRRFVAIVILITLAFFSHSTAPIFFVAGVVFGQLQSSWLRTLILVGAVLAVAGTALQYVNILQLTHGIPIVGKTYFALVAFQENGASSPRTFAAIGAAIFLLLPPTRWYEKVTAGFLALTLMVYSVPILNARLGIIGSSILIGVPYWMLLERILYLIAPRRNGATGKKI